LCFGKDHGFNVKDVFDTEFEILNAMACDLIKEVDEDDYNLITKEEALKNFGFNWEEFCKALGFKKIPDAIFVFNVSYYNFNIAASVLVSKFHLNFVQRRFCNIKQNNFSSSVKVL
jgi:hypothetical protein